MFKFNLLFQVFHMVLKKCRYLSLYKHSITNEQENSAKD